MLNKNGTEGIEFTAETRMSGTDFPDGKKVRKGAVDTIMKYILHQGGNVPIGLKDTCEEVAKKAVLLWLSQREAVYLELYI